VKLNWTGPIWLAVLPALSTAIVSAAERSGAFELAMRRVCVPTIAITLMVYGLVLNYLVLGIPGLGYAVSLPRAPVAWSEFGREAAGLTLEVKQATGDEPLMIGLDTYNVASQLAFYGNGAGDGNSIGRGILGRNSLMYEYWYRPEPLRGRPAVMFAFRRSQIVDPTLANHFTTLSDPMERDVTKGGKPAGRFYYRIGYNFKETDVRAFPAGAALRTQAATIRGKEIRADQANARNIQR
jgi:dolichol-phosphate mannosyltransferase